MKSGSAGLQATLYNFQEHLKADIISVFFPSGTQYFTTHSANITIGATTWLLSHPGAPGLTQGLGSEIGSFELELGAAGQSVAGLGFQAAALSGLFNGVRVLVQRARTRTNFTGYVAGDLETVFDGTCTKAVPRRDTVVVLTVQSPTSLGNTRASPRRVGAECPFSLGDASCGVTLGSFRNVRTVAAGSTASVVNLSSSAPMAAIGSVIAITSGAWAGQSRVIRGVSGVACTLDVPFPGIEIGVGCTITAACDKRITTCASVFSNATRCGACPNAPSDRK